MNKLAATYAAIRDAIFAGLKHFEGVAALLLRLYLVPIFWMAGTQKIDFSTLMPRESTVEWFGNPDWGLGMPLPTLMAFLAGWTEVIGAILLAIGFAVRWISIPLMFTMVVAATSAHLENGWQAIADPDAPFANERVIEGKKRLEVAKDILRENGNYSWLTGSGSIVVLNNGIEFAATYFLMLFALLYMGGGKYFSLDYWLGRGAGVPPLNLR